MKKRGHRHKDYVRDEAYLDYVRYLPCLVARECGGVTEPAHVKSRGAGGKDWANTVPLCSVHHHEQHTCVIKTFQRKYRIDLKAEAITVARDYAPLEDLSSW